MLIRKHTTVHAKMNVLWQIPEQKSGTTPDPGHRRRTGHGSSAHCLRRGARSRAAIRQKLSSACIAIGPALVSAQFVHTKFHHVAAARGSIGDHDAVHVAKDRIASLHLNRRQPSVNERGAE